MKKNGYRICQAYIILGALLAPVSGLKAHTITFQSKKVSVIAETLMHDHKERAMYQIFLRNVTSYLPLQHKIKRESIKLIAERYVPGKSAIKVLRHFTYDSGGEIQSQEAKDFFSKLEQDIPHTYVISGDRLIFTESTSNPALEKLKDIFTKHFLISGLQRKIHYSGEFFVHKNEMNNEVFVVFDNSSGTYKPPTSLLSNVQKLLSMNLSGNINNPDEMVYIITKSYDQKIDTERLFNHEETPFLKRR